MANKLRYASPPERLSQINLLCKQKSSGISESFILVHRTSMVLAAPSQTSDVTLLECEYQCNYFVLIQTSNENFHKTVI